MNSKMKKNMDSQMMYDCKPNDYDTIRGAYEKQIKFLQEKCNGIDGEQSMSKKKMNRGRMQHYQPAESQQFPTDPAEKALKLSSLVEEVHNQSMHNQSMHNQSMYHQPLE